MCMNLKPHVWINMGYTFLTLTAFLAHWSEVDALCRHTKMLTANCTQLRLYSPAMPPHSPSSLVQALQISTDTPACIWDGLWYNEDLDPCSCSLRLPVASTDAEWNRFTAYWCFVFLSHQSTSSANKCVFEWSYSCLTNENGNCWSQRNSMGDKADRPPQLIWKTARFLSESAF